MPSNRPRREFLDTVLSISAAVVAFSALVVTTYQTKIMREQQKMSAWPYVHLYNSNGNGAQLFVQNVGLGPALVRSVEVTVDGKLVRTYREMLAAVARTDTGLSTGYVKSDIGRGSVLLPGNAVEMYRLTSPAPLATMLHQANNQDRVVRRICYCSLYQDCWVADSHVAEPVAVPTCVIDTARGFRG